MTRNVQGNVSNTTDLDNVLNWFLNTLTVIFPRDKYKSGIKLMAANDEQLKRYYTELLKYFDTGIKTICLQPVKENKTNIPESILEQIKMDLMKQKNDNAKISLTNGRDNYIFSLVDMKLHIQKLMTQHAINGSDKDAYFDIADESDGTNRIIDYIPLIIDLLKGDKVFVVDEIERSLHPNLIYDIFDLFLDNCENINSQLIVSTHESSLLTQKLLRKDEIWFVVKDRQGASALHSLEDYSVRFDKEIRKDYLLGRYRGVPRLGSREKLDSLIIHKS
jgi:AAA15 family ATPase/GTPase